MLTCDLVRVVVFQRQFLPDFANARKLARPGKVKRTLDSRFSILHPLNLESSLLVAVVAAMTAPGSEPVDIGLACGDIRIL